MSDTPKTDDATWHTRTPGDPIGADVVYASFAAGLERELAAAIARIKRLEESGDVMWDILRDNGPMSVAHQAAMRWTQAKEAR
jgi:hypothetical protein